MVYLKKYIYIHVYIYIYKYTYIYTERERERDWYLTKSKIRDTLSVIYVWERWIGGLGNYIACKMFPVQKLAQLLQNVILKKWSLSLSQT